MNILRLTNAELAHLRITLEGCYEELEELMRTEEWFTTELTDRIETALDILSGVQEEE